MRSLTAIMGALTRALPVTIRRTSGASCARASRLASFTASPSRCPRCSGWTSVANLPGLRRGVGREQELAERNEAPGPDVLSDGRQLPRAPGAEQLVVLGDPARVPHL